VTDIRSYFAGLQRGRFSGRFGLLLGLGLLSIAVFVNAHNKDYALARFVAQPDGRFSIEVTCHIAAYVLGAEAGHLSLPDWQRLRKMETHTLNNMVSRAHDAFVAGVQLQVDNVSWPVRQVHFPATAAIRHDGLRPIPKEGPPIVITSRLPAGAESLKVLLPGQIGRVLLRIGDKTNQQRAYFFEAGRWMEIPSPFGKQVDGWGSADILKHYFGVGFVHILPNGLDHILFVLALFLVSQRVKTLLLQVTIFTVAHSVTLALALYDVVRLPAALVEPLIAFSIAAVALDNLVSDRLRSWRSVTIFAFGLLHGLGFANALEDVALNSHVGFLALAGFNIGVEAGQLVVVGIAFAIVGWSWASPWYRRGVVLPASSAIAAVGLVWTIQRLLPTSA